MAAAAGNGTASAKGRDFAVWLGLVPKQMSTGDRTDGTGEHGPDVQDGHDGSGGHHPERCCAAFSAYKRVIADVASSPGRRPRSKCAGARRSNADTAVNMTGGGGSARIGVLCEMPRGYMARASRSGSCKHGCGDQCGRQRFKLSHLISPLHVKSQRCVAPLWKMEQRSKRIDYAVVYSECPIDVRAQNFGSAVRADWLRAQGRQPKNDRADLTPADINW
jgi:hypothetical protein